VPFKANGLVDKRADEPGIIAPPGAPDANEIAFTRGLFVSHGG